MSKSLDKWSNLWFEREVDIEIELKLFGENWAVEMSRG